MPPKNQRPPASGPSDPGASTGSSGGSSASSGDTLSVKQQRDARRAEKVAALKKRQAREKRNRLIAIVTGSVAGIAVLALVITLVVTNGGNGAASGGGEAGGDDGAGTPDSSIEGLVRYSDLPANHVSGSVDYAQSPPVGGNHAAVWLNCGVYDEPVPNENAVHDLEHGAVWVTYNPDEVSGDELTALQAALPSTFITLSPWPDLQAPVVASAWGAQVELTGQTTRRLQQFIDAFWQSPDAPEPGAPCTGGLDAPGKVS